ncbi:sensor histidine kinase [Streptomyces cinnamoneus]|uniref:Two-component sensor histidine kinase n=1 Tax=Streptomyces cinnamoneus TaxID=53446 RepID=A0A918U1V2_STRCJ|nr:two-component sensor histidine kinase [Streptomyces cinnamoneus]
MAGRERRWNPWRAVMEVRDDATYTVGIGAEPDNRRQMIVKLTWIAIWFAYMAAPVDDVLSDHHTRTGDVLGGLGLLAFVAGYLTLVLRHTVRALDRGLVLLCLGGLTTLATLLSLTLGGAWLVLFVYVCVASGAVLPAKLSRIAIPLVTGVLAAIGATQPGVSDYLFALIVPALLGGFAMTGVRQMALTTKALREARATVAHLAANEERLRLARDLHDLLGHSLSLVTLKSELAGRMLPDRPEEAAQQVADIERVSRQALVDVREAVSGFRRPTLEAELAGARTALAAAGIAVDLTGTTDAHPDLPPDEEGALAWALREAVTNVVRHSGAHRCEVSLAEDGDEMCLTVTDNGRGPGGSPGNGLTGLTERLALADGRLETGAAPRGGFRLRACVPLSRPVAEAEVQAQQQS